MRYLEGVTVLDPEECEVAEHAFRHYLVWLDTVKATTKSAEPYGTPVEEEIARARNLKRSFHARTLAGRKEMEGFLNGIQNF